MSMKDSDLKNLLFQHHWAQRHFAQPEVELFLPGSVTENRPSITDVDVLALRPHPDLHYERMLGDCRTLRSQSAVNRCLWLSGLMRFVGARSGIVLLQAQRLETDHKHVANRVGVQLMNREEFRVYDKAKLFPRGSSGVNVTIDDLRQLRATITQKYPGLQTLATFIYRDAWQEPSFRTLIRRLVGYLRGAAGEIDPGRVEHLAFICDAAAVLGLGVAECTGKVFQQSLQPDRKEDLADQLTFLVWNGRDNYQFLQGVRQNMAGHRGAELPALELPEWNSFVQMVRHLLEQPSVSFQVPWFLRQAAIDIYRNRTVLQEASYGDLLAIKHAMLVVEYTARSSGGPRELESVLGEILVNVQSRIISASSAESVGPPPWTPK